MDFFTFDDEYVQRLREGDRWTEEHFRKYVAQYLRLTLRRKLAPDAIDDVTQEVLLRFYEKLRSPAGGIRDGRRLGPYITSIYKNYLSELYRQGKRLEPLTDQHLKSISPGNVVAELIGAEVQKRVRKMVAELPKKDADILRAIFLDERDPDDVCREFGVDRGYLRVLIHRAKKKFRDAWRGKPPDQLR